MSKLSILNRTGDLQHTWTPDDDAAFAKAQAAAETAVTESGGALIQTKNGADTVVKGLDRTAEAEYTVIPQIQGG